MFDLVTLARAPRGALRLEALSPADGPIECACCQAAPAEATVAGIPLCMTCQPGIALDEPEIDNLVSIIWLPHLDQGMLSRLVAAIHMAAAREGTTVHQASLTGRTAHARAAFKGLRALESEALQRLGTTRVSEFRAAALALTESDVANRSSESGLKLLFNGSWFSAQAGRYNDMLRESARQTP